MLAQRLLEGEAARGGAAALRGHYRLGGTEVAVSLYPAAGLVDLNVAPRQVLAALFLVVGRVDESEANYLADNMVKWRASLPAQDNKPTRARQFQAIEDLLRVEGVSRALFDAVRSYIVVRKGGGTATDWALAPDELMQVLEKANPGELETVRNRRASLARAATVSAAADSLQGGGQSLSGVFRVDAEVAYGDQVWLRRRWVAIGAAPGSRLPWHFVRTEPLRIPHNTNRIR